jgi:hypothetical protein
MISGCKKQEEKKEPAPITPAPAVRQELPGPAVTPSKVETAAPAVVLSPADARDDASYVGFFPPSNKIEGWVKTSPVRGGDASRIGDFLPDLARVLSSFSAKSIAAAQYERVFNTDVETVKVIMIQAGSKKDAYGMMSVACPGNDILKPGEVRREVSGTQVCLVKGDYFMIFSGSTEADETHLQEGMENLMAKIAFEIPERAEIPMVVQVFQTEKMPAATTLYMHDFTGIEGPAGERILSIVGAENVDRLNQLLALNPEVEVGVAVYTKNKWIGPDVIWLIKYPDRDKAIEVHNRYRDVVRKSAAADKLMSNTFFKAPRGRFLLGTWTAECESLAHLTNDIEKYLP